MRSATFVLALAVAIAVQIEELAARDLFVNNVAGENAYSGRQPVSSADGGGPVRTIGRALQLAEAGDRIVLANNEIPYRESITLYGQRNSGFGRQPFVIQGNGAILDGSIEVPREAWQHYQGPVFRFLAPSGAHQQLFLEGKPADRVATVAKMPQLQPRQWTYLDGYFYFRVEPAKLPYDYELRYAALQTGITLYFVRNVAILDMTIQGFQVDGLSAANTARDVYLAGLIGRGNGRSGVCSGGASRVEIDACLLGNNGLAQAITLPWSETQIRNSNLLGNTAPAWLDRGGRVYLGDKLTTGGRDAIKAVE